MIQDGVQKKGKRLAGRQIILTYVLGPKRQGNAKTSLPYDQAINGFLNHEVTDRLAREAIERLLASPRKELGRHRVLCYRINAKTETP